MLGNRMIQTTLVPQATCQSLKRPRHGLLGRHGIARFKQNSSIGGATMHIRLQGWSVYYTPQNFT